MCMIEEVVDSVFERISNPETNENGERKYFLYLDPTGCVLCTESDKTVRKVDNIGGLRLSLVGVYTQSVSRKHLGDDLKFVWSRIQNA